MDRKNHNEHGQPLVSVLLPNLNSRRFLEERLHTILDQTLTDWELVIVDNYSDDGSWELFQTFAKQDSRFKISQAPREGMYANWNNCLRLARGDYIYIATSDDTMSPDCLETMVSALEAHPECDICHTGLKVIDEEGQEIVGWWRANLPLPLHELVSRPHIRLAPYDGILHCAVTVIISMTQILIRRSVFDKIGIFRTDWGSEGDLEWGIRAGFVCNIVHIPETVATWRVHANQATATVDFSSSAPWARLCGMVNAALPILQQYDPDFYKRINSKRLLFPYRRQQFKYGFKEQYTWFHKMIFLAKFSVLSPGVVKEFLWERFTGNMLHNDNFTYIQRELKRLGLDHSVKMIDSHIQTE
jgi:glycosyltransferase involved in cell wall biosynthesis